MADQTPKSMKAQSKIDHSVTGLREDIDVLEVCWVEWDSDRSDLHSIAG